MQQTGHSRPAPHSLKKQTARAASFAADGAQWSSVHAATHTHSASARRVMRLASMSLAIAEGHAP
jgi:hypothetical protein